MSGGKGGSTSSTVEIPQYIEDAAKRNLARADTISQIGYVPYYGADVAAFTPMQEAAFQNTAGTAGAFGLAGGGMSQQDIMGGMPAPTTYAGGVRGYSSAPMFEQSMDELATRRPGQKALIDSLFIDPYSGVPNANVGPIIDYATTPGDLGGISVGGDGGGDGGGGLVSYPGAGGGNGSALSDAEIADYSQVIADEIGMDSFDPSKTAESQMTPEQYAEYQSQSMSNPAQLAADNIYMNNLATSGQGSLATGGMTGTTFGGDVAAGLNALSNIPGLTGLLANEAAEAMAPRNEYRNIDNSNRTWMETQLDYQAAQRAAGLASGAIPAFDPNDPSTWTLPSGQNAQQAFQEASTTPASTTPAATTFVNDYSNPATLAKYKADLAPGGVHYESSGSQRREAEQRAAIKAKDDALAQTIDTSEVINLAKSKDAAQQWLKANGYGSYDRDDAKDVLRSKVADIEKSQLQQGLKDGIIYTDDRYSVYVDGKVISNPKKKKTAEAKLKAATG